MPRPRYREISSQYFTILSDLMDARRINLPLLHIAPSDQGVYALWLAEEPPVCLKVGIAGPRRGKGLGERLALHFRSNRANSILARHLAADSPWPSTDEYDLRRRSQRR